MVELLSRNWGWIVLRGVVTILFGLLVILTTATSLTTLVLYFGIFAVVDGISMIISAAADRRAAPIWPELVFGGLFGIAAGVAAFVWPGITGAVLLVLIAAWAIFIGLMEIIAAIRLRKVIPNEFMLALAGLAWVALGVLIAAMPRAGATAIGLTIGILSICGGVFLMVLGFRLHSWARHIQSAARALA